MLTARALAGAGVEAHLSVEGEVRFYLDRMTLRGVRGRDAFPVESCVQLLSKRVMRREEREVMTGSDFLTRTAKGGSRQLGER